MTGSPAPTASDTASRPLVIERWHEMVATADPSGLPDLLADDVVFRSPAMFTPQEGRAKTQAYLEAAFAVLGPTVTYEREWFGNRTAVLEFTADVGGLQTHGIDMIAWDEHGRIVEFTVMVRPIKALVALIDAMGRRLAGQG